MYHTSYRWPNWLVVPTRLHDPSTLHTTQRTHCKKKKRAEIKIIRPNITVVPATNPVCRLVSESKHSGHIVRIFSKAGMKNANCVGKSKFLVESVKCCDEISSFILSTIKKNLRTQKFSQTASLRFFTDQQLLQRTQTKKATKLLWLWKEGLVWAIRKLIW